MHFLADKIKQLRIGWNRKSLGEADLYRICRRFRIQITEMPLRTDGFYYRVKGRDFIAVNSRLAEPMKLLVLFHELGHFLFHTPESGATANFHGVGGLARQEQEADVFALCALLPRRCIEDQTIDELAEASGLPAEKVVERLEIMNRYGF
jgi:Zn-dependent peptidase ImmA (M78 family)